MLQKRVQEIVELYWAGNVKAGAKQLVIPQNTLYRIVSGETPNPRANVLATIAKFAGTTVEYLLTGEGEGPKAFDGRGRPRTGAVARWLRLVESLYPERGGVREHLDDMVFGPLGFYAVIAPIVFDSKGQAKPRRNLNALNLAQDSVAAAWTDLLEDAIVVFGPDTVRKQLENGEIAVAGGFTLFARHLARGGMTKAEAKRYLGAWEDELTRGDGSPE